LIEKAMSSPASVTVAAARAQANSGLQPRLWLRALKSSYWIREILAFKFRKLTDIFARRSDLPIPATRAGLAMDSDKNI